MNFLNNTLNTLTKEPGFLSAYTSKGAAWLDERPRLYKAAIVANHLFRAVSMVGFMYLMPFSPLVNFSVSLVASIFYRVTIERFCQFRFTIASCLGAGAMMLALPAIDSIISGVAFGSLGLIAKAFVELLPLVLYGVSILKIANDGVDEYMEKLKQTPGANNKMGCCGKGSS